MRVTVQAARSEPAMSMQADVGMPADKMIERRQPEPIAAATAWAAALAASKAAALAALSLGARLGKPARGAAAALAWTARAGRSRVSAWMLYSCASRWGRAVGTRLPSVGGPCGSGAGPS